ncbi:MAG: cytochrome c-type biogenesis protein CcmH [Ilumatobacter sp.]|nr:cytochrome c-type biogenesis protein CcmH [Ilumatobacter sp.]
MNRSDVNRRLKRWPGWVVLLFVVVGLVAFGATRDTGPRTQDERIEDISKRLACPVCQGESVYESRNPASNQIREAVRRSVAEGGLSDEQIIADVALAYEGEELLVPTASGIEALAWALPATAFVVGVAGLAVAFRRWKTAADRLGAPTAEDYSLVESALEASAAERADPAADEITTDEITTDEITTDDGASTTVDR